MASQKNGKNKGVAGKSLPYSEVCDQVKNVLDQEEPLNSLLLAKLVKFKLLSIKSKDLDRRQEERRVTVSRLFY